MEQSRTGASPLGRYAAAGAGAHLTRNVPVAAAEMTAAEIRRDLEGRRFDSVADIAVCTDGRVRGVIPIAVLLAADGSALAEELMDADPPIVHTTADREDAAWKAVRHGETSLVVVDREERFVGLVPPTELLRVLLAEHDQDLSRLSGVLHRDDAMRSRSRESVARRFLHRLPWLLVGLAGALIAASLMAGFEGRIERNVTLAFFVPAIVYLADAVGTQTETLVIRGLSLGVAVREVFVREILTGVAIGLVLACAAGPLVWWLWGDHRVAIAFALAIVASCTIANVIAISLPALLGRAGADPAYGSGPLATVIQDVASIAIYFSIAVMLGA